ncbi:MAG: hypothetical protein AAGI90_06015 [Chlamydiota bacterium]
MTVEYLYKQQLASLYAHNKGALENNYNRRINTSNLPQGEKTRLINAGFTQDVFNEAQRQFDEMHESFNKYSCKSIQQLLNAVKRQKHCSENTKIFLKTLPDFFRSISEIATNIQRNSSIEKSVEERLFAPVETIDATICKIVYSTDPSSPFRATVQKVYDEIHSIKTCLEILSRGYKIATVAQTGGFLITNKINRVVIEILSSTDYKNLVQVLATSGTFSNQLNKMSLPQIKAFPTLNWIKQSLSKLIRSNDYEGLLKAIFLDDARQALNEVLKALQTSLNPSIGHLSEMKMRRETDVRAVSSEQGSMDVEKKTS